jgi:uncharacterized delta-60 repeat protein
MRQRKRGFAALTASLIVVLFASQAFATAGALDPTFNQQGWAALDTQALFGEGFSGLVIQADGGIVVAGSGAQSPGSASVPMLARYTGSGALDPNFGGAGLVFTSTVGSLAVTGEWSGLLAQTTGNLIALGRTGADLLHLHAVLVRFHPDGSLDASFGSGGAAVDAAPGIEEPREAVLQADGKILVLSDVIDPDAPSPGGPPRSFVVDRFTQDGALDAGFGTNGRAVLSFPVPEYAAGGVAVQPDGKIVVAGTCGEGTTGRNDLTDFCAGRLTPTGAVDPTFGGGDGAAYPIWGLSNLAQAFNVAVQPDGKIVVVGVSKRSAALARLLPDGSPDTSFAPWRLATSGRRTLGLGFLTGAIIQGTKILVFGALRDPAAPPDLFATVDWGLARLWAKKGALDKTFGPGGKVYVPVPNPIWGDSAALAAACTGDGTTVVVGFIATHGSPGTPDRDGVIARYLGA